MGAAVGFAVTQPWATGLLVFEALGLGLALPYLLLTLIPAWRRFLPRPGAWMKRLEQLLAFPLYASVAWLVWVVSQQAGPTGVAAALARPRPDRVRRVALPGLARRERDVAPRRPDRRRRARARRGGRRPAGRRRVRARPRAGGGRPCEAFSPAPPRGAARAGAARLRQRHRRLVHHLSRQRARGAPVRGGHRGVRAEGRGDPQGRLDEPRSEHHRGARLVRAERRAALPAVSARRPAAPRASPPCFRRSSARARCSTR